MRRPNHMGITVCSVLVACGGRNSSSGGHTLVDAGCVEAATYPVDIVVFPSATPTDDASVLCSARGPMPSCDVPCVGPIFRCGPPDQCVELQPGQWGCCLGPPLTPGPGHCVYFTGPGECP